MDEIVLGEIALAKDVVTLGGILEIAVDTRQKHLDGSTDNLQMTQLLGGGVHQQIVLVGIGVVAGEGLHEILHGRFQLAVAAAELLEQQAREPGVGPRNPGLELEFLGMVEHTLVFLVRFISACNAAVRRRNLPEPDRIMRRKDRGILHQVQKGCQKGQAQRAAGRRGLRAGKQHRRPKIAHRDALPL